MPYTYSSESVTEGHPDKVADAISDAVLDATLAGDAAARVACETLVTKDLCVIAGEIGAATVPDIEAIARKTIRRIGYTSVGSGFDADNCHVLIRVQEQSAEIFQGVARSEEARSGEDVEDDELQGAGDQGLMYGFACDETEVLMPIGPYLAHRLAERLSATRRDGLAAVLGPDGKTQVALEYSDDGKPSRIRSLLISTQHAPSVDRDAELRPLLWEQVVRPVVPEHLLQDTAFLVNPTGRFVHGGPAADTGLTGRKIIVDTYGGISRHGGGAFSGKDPSKVDRSAAYAARWVAKNVVASGAARRAEIQVAYAIGMANPISILVETFGTENVDPKSIEYAVRDVFDLRPAAIIRDLDLRKPIYEATAAYGHFGRNGDEFSWERTDRAEELRSALNL
ncbi:methionine adenosyltransferase [Nocardia salmonicida]|uniref:methionine adenosyltransferase n=1 Tax=Nocardia salmonicida TaxID=53431 RepID=UPI003626F80B